jgi:hypothetical protein
MCKSHTSTLNLGMYACVRVHAKVPEGTKAAARRGPKKLSETVDVRTTGNWQRTLAASFGSLVACQLATSAYPRTNCLPLTFTERLTCAPKDQLCACDLLEKPFLSGLSPDWLVESEPRAV